MNQLLARLKVLDAGRTPAVRYCGRLLALAGAAVHTVHADGTESRRRSDDYLDFAKTTLTDAELSSGYDLVIADPGYDWATVEDNVITGTVDPFTRAGARAGWSASEMVLASVGGAANYTRTTDGTPVYGFGNRFQFLAGTYLYAGLVSLIDAEPPAGAIHPRVRVANDEVVAALLPYGSTQYAYNGTTTTVEQSGPRFVVECTDGYLCVYAGGAWRDLARLLENVVAFDDERFVEFGARFAHVCDLEELVQKWSNGRTLADAILAAEAASVAVAPCYDLEDALADASLFDNHVLSRQTIGDREVAMAGLAYHVRETS